MKNLNIKLLLFNIWDITTKNQDNEYCKKSIYLQS